MARAKKASSSDMVRILNAYWETHGNPGKLKCSLLEMYAAGIGFDIKAYDFRRDGEVRRRIDELKAGGAAGFCALAYRNINADALIAENPTKPTLKTALTELDTYWRGVYDHAVEISGDNTRLLSENAALRKGIAEAASERDSSAVKLRDSAKAFNKLILENRYLKSALRRYLYPAVANEVLCRSGILKQVDTEATETAMAELSESSAPLSLSESVGHSSQSLSREQALLERMREQIGDTGGQYAEAER